MSPRHRPVKTIRFGIVGIACTGLGVVLCPGPAASADLLHLRCTITAGDFFGVRGIVAPDTSSVTDYELDLVGKRIRQLTTTTWYETKFNPEKIFWSASIVLEQYEMASGHTINRITGAYEVLKFFEKSGERLGATISNGTCEKIDVTPKF